MTERFIIKKIEDEDIERPVMGSRKILIHAHLDDLIDGKRSALKPAPGLRYKVGDRVQHNGPHPWNWGTIKHIKPKREKPYFVYWGIPGDAREEGWGYYDEHDLIPAPELKENSTDSTAENDRNRICEIGQLFWGDSKQCYSADAVYREVKARLKSVPEPECSHPNLKTEGRRTFCPDCDFILSALKEPTPEPEEDEDKREEKAIMSAERINLSAHEQTWTEEEQYEMGRLLLKYRSIVYPKTKPKEDEWADWKRNSLYSLRKSTTFTELWEGVIDAFDKMPRCKCGKEE